MKSELSQWLTRPPQAERARTLRAAAWVISALVLLLVVAMRKIHLPLPAGWSTAALPPFHATVNAIVAVVLIGGLACIKLGKVRLHRAMMVAAMALSVVFLLSYVAYHLTTEPVRFGGAGPLRAVYFFLLITHVLFAAISLPFILFTFIAGWTNHFRAHRKLARWVYPLWLYVAVTGPVCYLMLRPYYP